MHDEIKIEIHGLEILMNRLDKCKRLQDPICLPLREAMSQAVQLIEAQAKDNLTENASVASGALRAKGIGSDIQMTAEALTGIVYADIRNAGFNYAEAVEFGTRAGHLPPLAPLEEWVRLKGLTGVITLSRGKNKRLAQIEAIRVAAKQVQWNIFQHGTQAHPFFEPAVIKSRDDVLRLFESAVDKIVNSF